MVHTPLEVKLAEERNLLRMVIDNLPDVIYAKDSGARKILANQADLKLMGCKTEAEVVGKTDFEFYPKDIAAKLIQDDHLVLWQGQSIIGREEKIIKHDGEICWLLTTKVPWRDVTGRVIGLVGIGRDITDRKRLEEQSQQTRRMENIGQRTSGIANDLKDVLTPILDSIVSLRQKIKDKEGVKLLDSVEADAKRGVDVVNESFGLGANWKADATRSMSTNSSKASSILFLKRSAGPLKSEPTSRRTFAPFPVIRRNYIRRCSTCPSTHAMPCPTAANSSWEHVILRPTINSPVRIPAPSEGNMF